MSNASDFVIENGFLKEYKGRGKNVVIPEGVTAIAWSTFTNKSVTSVTLPEGVKEIGGNAFYYCQNLKKIVLPQSLEKIGGGAFNDCEDLEELVFPESLREIGERAFAGCKKLNAELPSNLTVIGDAAFRNCGFKKLVIPASVKKIGKDAFKGCAGIKTAGPVGGDYDYQFYWITEIPDNAFSGLNKLKSAVLPATIEKVGGNSFNGCKLLTDLIMPGTATVHKTAFKGCDKLVNIQEPAAPAKAPEEKSDFLITNGRLVQYHGKNEEVVIPDGVTIIGEKAFCDMNITSVTIPASVTVIEQEAFGNCARLETVRIVGTIEKVGAMAFGWEQNQKIEPQIYNAVPIQAFAGSNYGGQDDAVEYFCGHITEWDAVSEVYRDNVQFLGGHLKQKTQRNNIPYPRFLAGNEALLHTLLEADAIPVKDVDTVISALEDQPQTVAALLDYKNRILSDPKAKKALEKSEKRAMEKAFSGKMSVADWRKIFKFVYEDGEVVITETKSTEPEIVVPTNIGSKRVRAIGLHAFNFAGGKKSPKTITISEGIREIHPEAFLVVNDCDIYFPSTVTALLQGCFTAVQNLTLHLPATLTEIPKKLAQLSSDNAIKAIYAPAGSYAETYAKENNIPFVAE